LRIVKSGESWQHQRGRELTDNGQDKRATSNFTPVIDEGREKKGSVGELRKAEMDFNPVARAFESRNWPKEGGDERRFD